MADTYAATALAQLGRVVELQRDAIAAGGAAIAGALASGGILHAYGTGHSRSVALELVARAGGLIPTNLLAIKDLVLWGDRPPESIRDPKLERESGVAEAVLGLHDVRAGDVMVIASNSGLNPAIVEMARLVRDRSVPVIAIGSVEHSRTMASRDASGTSLFDNADVVVDTLTPAGDAVVPLPSGGYACGTSTLSAVLAAQLLVARAIEELERKGVHIPVYRSMNTSGADAPNAEAERAWAGRLRPVEA
nr:sugar isomerase domain-containing protein [Streptomyces coryli]